MPPKEAFFNFLRKEAISDDSYAHGERVWRELGFTKMEEFCEMYLSLDILLLSKLKRCLGYVQQSDSIMVIFLFFSSSQHLSGFPQLSLREYGLAPENFYSLPGLSLAAALKLTNIELELISDSNLYLWWESMIRGK